MRLKSMGAGVGILGVMVAALLASPPAPRADGASRSRVLLYEYAVTGAHQKPRAYLREALERLSQEKGFTLTVVSEKKEFTVSELKAFDLVVLSNGDGNVFAGPGEQALEQYVREGGGLIAVHAAGVLVTRFPFLSEALGSKYDRRMHGVSKQATVYAESRALAKSGASLFNGLPPEVTLTDRWMSFHTSPRNQPGVEVLLSLDEASLGVKTPRDRPLVWTRKIGSGTFVYNSLGGEDVYTQADGYGEKLLGNLMEYAVSAEPVRIGAAGKPLVLGMTAARNQLQMSLPAGRHTLRITDSRGKVLELRVFEGPGNFNMPLAAKRVFLVELDGPGGRLKKRIVTEALR
jgi:type 1 glutamine amidotransferase